MYICFHVPLFLTFHICQSMVNVACLILRTLVIVLKTSSLVSLLTLKVLRLIILSQHYPIRIGIVNAPNDDPVISRCFVNLRAGSFSGLLSDCSSVVIEEEQYECDVEVWSRYRCFNLLLVILNSLNYSVAESHSKIPLVCTHVDIKKAICNVEAYSRYRRVKYAKYFVDMKNNAKNHVQFCKIEIEPYVGSLKKDMALISKKIVTLSDGKQYIYDTKPFSFLESCVDGDSEEIFESSDPLLHGYSFKRLYPAQNKYNFMKNTALVEKNVALNLSAKDNRIDFILREPMLKTSSGGKKWFRMAKKLRPSYSPLSNFHTISPISGSSMPTLLDLTSRTESTTSFHHVETNLNFDSKSYCSLYKDLRSPDNSENIENFISDKVLPISNDIKMVSSTDFKHSLSTTFNNVSHVTNLEMQSSSIRPLDKHMYQRILEIHTLSKCEEPKSLVPYQKLKPVLKHANHYSFYPNIEIYAEI